MTGPRLRLSVFGGLRLRDEATSQDVIAPSTKPLAVLAYLLVSGRQGAGRDALAATLWPALTQERAHRALSQTLYSLRRDLPEQDIIAGRSVLVLREGAVARDWDELTLALQQPVGSYDDAERLQACLDAPRGEFLEGVYFIDCPAFTQWVDGIRADLIESQARAAAAIAKWRAVSSRTLRDGAPSVIRDRRRLRAGGAVAAATILVAILGILIPTRFHALPPRARTLVEADRLARAQVREERGDTSRIGTVILLPTIVVSPDIALERASKQYDYLLRQWLAGTFTSQADTARVAIGLTARERARLPGSTTGDLLSVMRSENAPLAVQPRIGGRGDSTYIHVTYLRLFQDSGQPQIESVMPRATFGPLRGPRSVLSTSAAHVIGTLRSIESCGQTRERVTDPVAWCWHSKSEVGLTRSAERGLHLR